MRFHVSAMTMTDIEAIAQAGADGLIFGVAPFCLRSVCVPSFEHIQEAIHRCHACGVKALFSMNAFLYEDALSQAKQQLTWLIEMGADGIYFADEALLSFAQELRISDRMIYQPDTLLTNHMDVNYYLKEGVQAVVLSKEITLQEIISIAKNSDAKRIEVIGHGHVVMMHSRRPLLSSYMEFIGKDLDLRDKHDLYLMEDTREDRLPIMEDAAGTHIFSAYVLNSFLQMKAFMEADIAVMRLDGIFHTSEELMMALALYDEIRKGKLDGMQAFKAYHSRYSHLPLGSGFYDQATGVRK